MSRERFGLEIPVVVRSRAEPAAVVKRNPLQKVATEPKRYQVSSLSAKLPAKVVREPEAVAEPEERVGAIGREVYAWHPGTIARWKLWARLVGKGLGVRAGAQLGYEALLNLADSQGPARS